MADTKPKLALKLFIHKEKGKIVFAEAKKDFIDFLFNLLTLPLGTVTQIVTKSAMVGGIGNIYKSVECLNDNYFLSNNDSKNTLIMPIISGNTTQMISPLDAPPQKSKFYLCSMRNGNHTPVDTAKDSRASGTPTIGVRRSAYPLIHVSYKHTSAGEGGYVKDEVPYMVADDMSVEPLSSTAILKLLSLNGIQHMGVLEEKVFNMDMDKGLKLLKASLQSRAVLTNVFLSEA